MSNPTTSWPAATDVMRHGRTHDSQPNYADRGSFSVTVDQSWAMATRPASPSSIPNRGPALTISAIGQLITAGTVSERATSNRWAVGAPPDRHDSRRIPKKRREVLERVLGDDDVTGLHVASLLGAVEPHHSARTHSANAWFALVHVPLKGQHSRQDRLPAAHARVEGERHVGGHEVFDHAQELLSQRPDRSVAALAARQSIRWDGRSSSSLARARPVPTPGFRACPTLGRSAWSRSGGPRQARLPGHRSGCMPTAQDRRGQPRASREPIHRLSLRGSAEPVAQT